MPEQGYQFDRDTATRVVRMLREYERTPKTAGPSQYAPAVPQGGECVLLRITSATPTSGLYPCVPLFWDYDDGYSDGDAAWALMPNSETPVDERRYAGRRMTVKAEDGKLVYAVTGDFGVTVRQIDGGAAGPFTGITTIQVKGVLTNPSAGTVLIGYAGSTEPGLLSIAAQNIAGYKTFRDGLSIVHDAGGGGPILLSTQDVGSDDYIAIGHCSEFEPEDADDVVAQSGDVIVGGTMHVVNATPTSADFTVGFTLAHDAGGIRLWSKDGVDPPDDAATIVGFETGIAIGFGDGTNLIDALKAQFVWDSTGHFVLKGPDGFFPDIRVAAGGAGAAPGVPTGWYQGQDGTQAGLTFKCGLYVGGTYAGGADVDGGTF